jgi:hypothetical protein
MKAKLYQQSLKPSTKSWILEFSGVFSQIEDADIHNQVKHFCNFHKLDFHVYYETNMNKMIEFGSDNQNLILNVCLLICKQLKIELEI